MNLLKSPLRRTTAAIGGALIGLAGVLVFAAPAGAHHPIVSVGTRCAAADGSWQVTWHVLNSEGDVPGKIRELVSEPGVPVEGLAVGTEFPVRSGGVITGTQRFGADVESATLKLKGEWVRNGHTIGNDGFHPEAIGQVSKPTEKCEEPSESPSPSPSESPSATPSESPSATPSESPSATRAASPSASATPSVPAEEPGLPAPIIEGDCSSMTIGMDNPADGMPLTLTFETSEGEKRELKIAPGEAKTEKFEATEGFTVKITLTIADESATETVEFQPPADCGGSGGGELPLTGAAAGSIAGGAGALLAVGGVLFFLARRRKVKFTA